MSYAIRQAMREELTRWIEEAGETFDDIRDKSGEFIDGYLPVYNGQIIDEWRCMPHAYDNTGYAELGHLGHEIDIINLMSLDLYLYYTDLFHETINGMEAGEE
jgi:hypothetical protein